MTAFDIIEYMLIKFTVIWLVIIIQSTHIIGFDGAEWLIAIIDYHAHIHCLSLISPSPPDAGCEYFSRKYALS